MKATDLMIGDWVEYGGYITTVRNLSDKIVLSGCVGRLDEVRPVSLTPEILEKNGFENVYSGRYRFDDDKSSIVEVSTINNEIKWVRVSKYDENIEEQLSNCTFNDMHFIHELQHALKLCGIEKEIIL